MNREWVLRGVLIVVGLLFLAGIYPLTDSLWHVDRAGYDEDMMLSLYVAIGVFLLIAARNPSANSSLIVFTAWSGFAHAAVMAVIAFQTPSRRLGILAADTVLGVIGVALLTLAPARHSGEHTRSRSSP